MKAQFMLISAVVAGLLMIAVGATITGIQDRTFQSQDASYDIRYIEEEASKITEDGTISQLERANYEQLLSKFDYSYDVEYWETEDQTCLNVTLISADGRMDLNCIGAN